MTQSKITLPLFLGIVGTIGFDLSPILYGSTMTMNICFALYAAIMFAFSLVDRRVLGYATVLSACNPANATANLSFSFLLAILTIFKEALAAGGVIRGLSRRHWGWLFLASFLLIGLSVPFWPGDLRTAITEVKRALGRLGYLAVLPIAIGTTIRDPRDGARAMRLLCFTSIALFVLFYSRGQVGGECGTERFIGQISMNFSHTQAAIPVAALTVGTLALAIGTGFNLRALPLLLASCVCVLMLMMLGSVGSAGAMVCGLGVLALGYYSIKLSLHRILLGTTLFLIVGGSLYWAVFHTENWLSHRIDIKRGDIESHGIDRMVYWQEGIVEICKTPFGEGWSSRTGHSDWLLFLLSYGWPTGLLYIAATGVLFVSMWRQLRFHSITTDRPSNSLLLVGMGTLTVYVANSVFDMLSANITYYETVWALILTSATVVALADAAENSRFCRSNLLPARQRYGCL
jgi:hypothetical protein